MEDPGSISMVTSVGQVAEEKSYQEAFDSFDWNKNGTIPVKVSKQKKIPKENHTQNCFSSLFWAAEIASKNIDFKPPEPL